MQPYSQIVPSLDGSDIRQLVRDIGELPKWRRLLEQRKICWLRLGYRTSEWPRPHDRVVQEISGELTKHIASESDCSPFLFCGDRRWHRDNRIIRYHGFWGRRERPEALATLPRIFEAHVESSQGLLYYTTCLLEERQIPSAAVYLRQKQNGFLLLVRDEERLVDPSVRDELFQAVYPTDKDGSRDPRLFPEWTGLLEWALPNRTITIRPFGQSDDPFAGLDFFGPPDVFL